MNAITVSGYSYETRLGRAEFHGVRLELLPEADAAGVTMDTFDPERHGHRLSAESKARLDEALAATFLAAKCGPQDDGLLSSIELQGVEEFLGLDQKTFALLLGVSLGALAAIVGGGERLLSKYLSSRAIVLLETELREPGFAQRLTDALSAQPTASQAAPKLAKVAAAWEGAAEDSRKRA